MQNILRYISSNYSHKISLEDIAGKIGFHPQYFSSYFKKLFNINFTDYLNNYRVEKSTSMLRNTKDSILNISVACGFNNHKTFSNAFEKRYGMTPGKYRKAVLSASQSIEEDNHGEDFDYLRYLNSCFEYLKK